MKPPAQHRKQDMNTRQLAADHRQRDEHQYALRRGLGFWELTFEGRQAVFKHELGALYVACLLLDPPPEPIHAVARREREEMLEFLRNNSWRTRDNAGRCVRAVAVAIKRFHARLAKAVDAEGRPHPVLQGFAGYLREHLLIPSGRGGDHGGARARWSGAGCFTYEPPSGVVWGGTEHPTPNIQHPTSNVEHRAIANSR